MASLYFADQKAQQQQQSEEDSSQKLQEEEEDEAKEETPNPTYPQPSDTKSVASSTVAGMSYVGNDGTVKQLDPEGKEASVLYAQVEDPNGKEEEGEIVLDAKVEAISPTSTMGDEGFSQMSGLTDLASTRYLGPSHTTKSKSPQPQPDEEQPNANKKSCPWMILITCCLILAGGIGGGLAGALKKDKKDAAPTPAPTMIFNPTEGKPPKPSPPSPVAPSTLAPVIPSPPSSTDLPPLNDQCAGAMDFSLLTFGSTATATAHPELSDLNCGVDALDGAGVWYQVTGTGSELTASTCSEETNFDTKLSLFTGSCDSLQCVTTNDDQVGSECDVLSTVVWMSETGATYYILVRTQKIYCISLEPALFVSYRLYLRIVSSVSGPRL
jgi:hypothetical protein